MSETMFLAVDIGVRGASVMAALGVPVAFLTPPTWKRLVGIAPGKEAASKARCLRPKVSSLASSSPRGWLAGAANLGQNWKDRGMNWQNPLRPFADNYVTHEAAVAERSQSEPPDPHYVPLGEPAEAAPPAQFKSVKAFCDEYAPLSYAVEPFIRSASLYTLTAKTGGAKTALLIIMALAIATGRNDILGREVTRGRVAYIAAENPDDLRMRIMVAAFLLNIDLAEIADDLVILDKRMKPEELEAKLKLLTDDRPFSLILIDTLAAFFDGKNINDAVEGGEFMRRLRPLTRLGGLPSVIVAAHPVKNAQDDNLIPYGSGAILNEVDGNLTLCKKPSGLVSLHWQGKLRGIEFAAAVFRIEIADCPDVLDTKGRRVSLPVLTPSSEEEAERREQISGDRDAALLLAIAKEPRGSIRDWATATGISKSSVGARLKALGKKKLVEQILDKWALTATGRKAIKDRESAMD
jgi:hypothetical protein